ncbi:MAG: 50S ribosomal protein L10 [Anaerolineae bacterium]
MAISRERKEELVAIYKQQMAESNGVILANFTALTMPQMQDLRRRAREYDVRIYVIKNTLLDVVLKEQGMEAPQGLFTKPMMAAFCHEDVGPTAKLFLDFAKEVTEDNFLIKGGIMEGRFLDQAQARALADLPTRDVLLSQVLRTINAPATQVAGVVASGIRQVLNVLQAYVDKLEGEGGAAAEAAA